MPRKPRQFVPGVFYHACNRAVRKAPLFQTAEDFEVFEELLSESLRRFELECYAYQLMGNHWHLLLRPGTEQAISRAMHWLCTTHSGRWHLAKGTRGTGSVYQDRFKAFAVQDDTHLLSVWRYVERNALRAGLAARAEEWVWGSLWQRLHRGLLADQLADWADVTGDLDWWIRFVNTAQTPAEIDSVRQSLLRELPLGDERWRQAIRARRTSA